MASNEVALRNATEMDFAVIRRLAHEIWWPTYGSYLAHGQISLMLEQIYSESALMEQAEAGQVFTMAMRGDIAVGFVGFKAKRGEPCTMRIEKLYVAQSEHGKGTGTLLINHIAQVALTTGCSALELNVNRYNPAIGFYTRLGFAIVETVDIVYHGYTLNDYVMRKDLVNGG